MTSLRTWWNNVIPRPVWWRSNQFGIINSILSTLSSTVHRPVDIKNRPRIPIPDEDPYSVAGNGGGSSGSSGLGASGSGMVGASRDHLMQGQPMVQRRSEKPPKLPPRDNLYASHEIVKVSDEFCILQNTVLYLSGHNYTQRKIISNFTRPLLFKFE